MVACRHCGSEHPHESSSCPVTGEPMSVAGPCGGRIDRYEVQRLLGMGGFGAVYRAQHVHTGQEVALKVLKRHLNADAGMLERLLREARAATSVGSDHIVRVLDAGVSPEGQAFLAMELLDGWDLKELVTRTGPMPLMRSALVVLQVLDALSSAHQKGIVHRDLKPANVFLLRVVGETGVERDFVKLLDFGISKMHQEGPISSMTLPGMAMGTPAYMAPEQFGSARDVDARADLYSVAVMLYELAAGKLPFDAESYADLIVKVRTSAPPSLGQVVTGVPPALVAVIDRGLAREPGSRWQSAAEMADALRAATGVPRRSSRLVQTGGPRPSPSLDATYTPSPSVSDISGPSLGATAPPSPSSPAWKERTPPMPSGPRAAATPSPAPASAPPAAAIPVGIPVAMGAAAPAQWSPPPPAQRVSSATVPKSLSSRKPSSSAAWLLVLSVVAAMFVLFLIGLMVR